jgi:hypothetical protein
MGGQFFLREYVCRIRALPCDSACGMPYFMSMISPVSNDRIACGEVRSQASDSAPVFVATVASLSSKTHATQSHAWAKKAA